MSHNHLQQLNGGSFSGLIALRSLELSHNRLEQLTGQAIAGMDSLQALFVRQNRLIAIPAHALRILKSVRLVDLSHNEHIQQLRELDFAHNFARRIVLNGLTRLHRIHRLTFFDLPALLDVRLRGARSLTYLDEQAFAGTSQLRSLSLQKSGLYALDAKLLDALGRHTQPNGRRVRLELGGSAFSCNCLIKPIHNVSVIMKITKQLFLFFFLVCFSV